MQPVRVLDGLRGKGHRQALRHRPVADVVPVEGHEEEGERIAVPEDLHRPVTVLAVRRCRCLLLLRLWHPCRLIPLPEFRPPLRSPAAARVVTAGEDRAVRKLDRKRSVLMRRRERALGEDVEGAAPVGSRAPHGDAVVEEPGGEVDAGSLLLRFFTGEEPCEVPEPFLGNNSDLRWNREDLRPAVRPLRRAVALPGERAVEFPDPGGVVVRGIDGHDLVREEGVEGRESAPDNLRCRLVVWKVDPVEQVRPVPGIGQYGRREPLFREIARDPLGHSERSRVLGVRR
ncbi:hypothetical protein DSECCO2_570620 [anaerobic digester metagenome]